MKILIVDDNEINLFFLEELLNSNHKIDKALNGKVALDKINTFQPDIVLLDIMMPVMDGIETLTKIRKNYLTSHFSVIMITAKSRKADVKEALTAGANDYIKKPIDTTELFTKINIQSKIITARNELQQFKVYANIKESMAVALRFQTSLLPDNKNLMEIFPDSFVLNLPKDIVSGDFYNFYKLNSRKIVTLYDCEGHGVPAAMMSLAIHFVASQYITKDNEYSLKTIVEKIIFKLKQTINQSNDIYTEFGFDAAFLEIIETEMLINFIGAHRPLIIIRKDSNELIVNNQIVEPRFISEGYSLFYLKGNIHRIDMQDIDYDCKSIKIEKNDSVYIFSDGYADQFVSNFDKMKISIRGLSELLISNQHLTMLEQKLLLYNNLKEYVDGFQQIDDVLIIGIKI